jgi:PAS domain S-box-containing protein/putative nucleotidyltransferase with HDIG domain
MVESIHEGEDIIITGNREKRIWDFSSSPLGVLPDGRRIVISMAKDVTAQKHAEALQSAVYRISDATSSNIGMDEFYRVVHEALKSVMVAENFYIALYDRESDLLSFPYYADERDEAPRTAPLGEGPTGYVIRKGEPLFGKSETMKALEEQGILVPSGTRSIDWLGVPLKIRNETIGVMAVQTYDQGTRYTQRDLDILGYVSKQVASSIERKQAEEALQTSEMRYRLSAQATNDVIWEWDIDSGEEVWSENLHTLFGYNVQEVSKATAWWESHIHPQDSQRVLEKLNNILLNEENIWEDEYRFIRSDGSVAYIVDRGYIERDINGKPVRMIGAMSDSTDRRRREEELETLASVSAALRVAGSRTEILQVVLDQILLRFDARGAVLTLRRTGTDDLVVEGARGEWINFLGTRAPMSGSVSRHVMETGKPHVENDLSADTLLSLNGLAKGTGSFISAPLSTPSGMIGALNIGRSAPFRPEDVRLVMNIADMAANAIQRASAYEQMKQQIERIKVLRTIDLFIASGADLHLTMQTILNQAVTHLGVDAADILTLNQSVHALEYAEGVGFRTTGVKQTSLRLGEGFAGQAVLKREMIVVEDITVLTNHPLFVLEGFIRYYGVPLIAKGDVKGVMEVLHRGPLDVDRDWLDFLESLAAQAALAMDNASLFSSLQRSNLELGIAYEATLEGWSAALDLRDKETEGHTQRVTNLTLALAEAMGVSEKEKVQIRRGALLHDIGKMGIPDRILLKPDVLTGEEWEIMRQHPVYAYKLLYPIPHLRPALDIPYCHHERWDGSGYPRGLKEEAIPLAARIFAVADVWDALRSDRPYRPAWDRDTALSYIKSLSGVHFDPKVIEAFLKLI